jgi:membrane-bound lytic murein transglycosylase A
MRMQRLAFAALAGWAGDDHAAAFAVFRESCRAILAAAPELRPGLAPSPGLVAACRAAENVAPAEARAFFEARFTPWRIRGADGGDAVVTGYYEPEVDASLAPAPGFATALRARPADLVTWPQDTPPAGAPKNLAAARRMPDGSLAPMPTRAAIDAGALGETSAPLAYVRDPVEAFMIQVQGSARLRLPDGRGLRAVYDGRNGHPYTSIGRVLASERAIPPEDLTLEKLKAWVRAAGQKPGEDGLALLHRNQSFVFFRLDATAAPEAGPIGAQGLRLTRLRSIAVDRTIWPYGTPVWIDATVPWESEAPSRLARLTVAQDTGSAILGPARADIFHGAGEQAGRIAGATRHRGAFVVLLPNGEPPPGAEAAP